MLEVGDIVKVRSDMAKNLKYGTISAEASMIALGGKEMTIQRIDSEAGTLYMTLVGSSFAWTEEMLISAPKKFVVGASLRYNLDNLNKEHS